VVPSADNLLYGMLFVSYFFRMKYGKMFMICHISGSLACALDDSLLILANSTT
jgi:hypothetical protein